jgi:hypothetical protein
MNGNPIDLLPTTPNHSAKTGLNIEKWLLVAALVLVPVACRQIPWFPNAMPVSAVALFAGAWFRDWRLMLGIPLLTRLLSDLMLGYETASASEVLVIYACLAFSVACGWLVRNQRQQPLPVLTSCLASAVVFFLVTNFGVWLASTPNLGPFYYPPTLAGLARCYEMAWPFFRGTLVGDIVYTGVLFGGYAFAASRYPAVARATA